MRGQSNIIVDIADHARVGLATITHDPDSVRNAPDNQNHTARWTVPENLDGREKYSEGAVGFSFAISMIEVRSGSPPVRRALWFTL